MYKSISSNPFLALYTACFIVLCLATNSAWAHTEAGVAGGLTSGLLHPVLGLDHLLAMVAVGLWGAQLGNPAIWLLPISFPLAMALGGLLGVMGVPLPAIELAIGLSALLLGIMVALQIKPAFWVAATLVAFFALFHGHAHGTELPSAANPLAYGVGFVVSTGLLHLVGILLGSINRWPSGSAVIRAIGGVIAVCGAYFSAASLS